MSWRADLRSKSYLANEAIERHLKVEEAFVASADGDVVYNGGLSFVFSIPEDKFGMFTGS